ncbi:MAG: YfhO family protein [Ruminococcus sp.]|nr:YfhO family protein [Ruminococcus sp.]
MFKKSPYLKGAGERQKEKYLLLFITAFVGMLICFIPSMIANKGIFLYYGDFNSQQMMFYKHAQEMVKDGNLGWDWGTDLGSGFVGSYSFYLLGSPFFWLTALFPKGATVYLMPWLLSLKTAVAAVCAYAYIRRFASNPDAAYIGGLLYAFSGFQTYNVFFNHFHDATAFFPLLLLGFEMLVQDNKKGPFAVAVAICATISYFFFVCDAVFLVIYFFLRCIDKDFDIDMKKFILLIVEAVIGVMISATLLLPSVLGVLSNYRVNERLFGKDLIFYGENVRIPRIIQAFFMLSDMPARINILSSDNARWASLAGYLPMFSMAGVIAYMRTHKKNWAYWAIIVFGIMACVPVLNSAFVLFNASYYARWYYMPILLMCMMTSKVLSDNKDDLKKGFIPVVAVALFFIGVGLLPTQENGVTVYGKIAQYIELYYIQAAVTILMLVMLGILIYFVAEKKVNYMKVACAMTAAACVICNTSSVLYGVAQGSDNADYIERAINGGDNIDMDKLEASSANYNENNNFYRIDTSENVDNWCMFWDLSSMRCFHSVVSTSIMDFYSEIDQTRDVASRMEQNVYPLRSLFSVKYYFNELPESQRNGTLPVTTPQNCGSLKGFTYVDTQNGFNIYENDNYIPMGFTYDYYVTDAEIKQAEEVEKTEMLMKALVLDTKQAYKYKDVISYYNFTDDDFTTDEYNKNCADRKAESCSSFSYDSYGFDAAITLDNPKLVFFSVPYDDGWSAEVNGQSADIEKVDYGFMAVLCPAGESEIHFTYETPGIRYGNILTGVGFVSLFAYVIFWHFKKDEKPECEQSEKPENGGGKSETDESAEDTAKTAENSESEDVSDSGETSDNNAEQSENISETEENNSVNKDEE